MNRLVIVPDAQLEAAGTALKAKLAAITSEIDANNIVQLMGPLVVRCLVAAARECPDAELLLWAPEGKDFAVAWSSAANARDVEGKARAAAGEGMIAGVFESHRAVAESGRDLQAGEWTNLDRLRGTAVTAMAASPVLVSESCAAVLCRVRYAGADGEDLPVPSEAAALIARLVEDRLIRATLGLESS